MSKRILVVEGQKDCLSVPPKADIHCGSLNVC